MNNSVRTMSSLKQNFRLTPEEVFKFLNRFFDDKVIGVTASSAVGGAAITGIATLIGALLLGPRGFIAGAGAGSMLSYCLYKDKFSGLVDIWKSLSSDARWKIALLFMEWLLRQVLPYAVESAVEFLEQVKLDQTLLYAIVKFLSSILEKPSKQ